MNFIKRNICTILTIALFVTLGMVDCAWAEAADTTSGTPDVMGVAQTKAITVFQAVKKIIFIVGGFGLVVLAFAAIFGKLDWKKFSMLAVGLAILAAAGSIINYATGDQVGGSDNALGDSFTSSAGS